MRARHGAAAVACGRRRTALRASSLALQPQELLEQAPCPARRRLSTTSCRSPRGSYTASRPCTSTRSPSRGAKSSRPAARRNMAQRNWPCGVLEREVADARWTAREKPEISPRTATGLKRASRHQQRRGTAPRLARSAAQSLGPGTAPSRPKRSGGRSGGRIVHSRRDSWPQQAASLAKCTIPSSKLLISRRFSCSKCHRSDMSKHWCGFATGGRGFLHKVIHNFCGSAPTRRGVRPDSPRVRR